jgi:hypothetical protein
MNDGPDPSLPADMRAALDAFDQQADAIVRDFVQTIEVATPPPMLHPYTNAAGLQGILASGHIWLSDTFRMNDPSEVEHGFSIAAERLSNCVTATRPETECFARGFEAFLTQGSVKASGHFFSASFSGDGDDLGSGARMATMAGALLRPLMARCFYPTQWCADPEQQHLSNHIQ